jgi:protein SCO1/2
MTRMSQSTTVSSTGSRGSDSPRRGVRPRLRSCCPLLAVVLLGLGAGGRDGDGWARALMPPTAAAADRQEPLPKQLEGVGITEHLNTQIPLDLEFTDESGATVRLGDYFQGHRPVILNLVYYSCPMLCTLVLNGVTDAMKQLKWQLGDQYENVTVSIDPSETPTLAASKKETYLGSYGRGGAGGGWHFLTGKQENITALAQAVGFNYRYDPATRQFYHTAATFICTPDGRVSRYLYGVEYDEQTMRLALLEASSGKIGNTIDKLILYCCQYDPGTGRYTPIAFNIMRLMGGLTALAVGGLILVLWLRDRARRRRHAVAGAHS